MCLLKRRSELAGSADCLRAMKDRSDVAYQQCAGNQFFKGGRAMRSPLM
jgi:hypothetical protein